MHTGWCITVVGVYSIVLGTMGGDSSISPGGTDQLVPDVRPENMYSYDVTGGWVSGGNMRAVVSAGRVPGVNVAFMSFIVK